MSYIYQQVGESNFIQAMSQVYDNTNFTYEGKKALFAFLSDLAEDTGEPIELDPIALCCEYTEYANIDDVIKSYNNPRIKDLGDLEEYTTVIPFDGGIIIQDF